MARCAYCGAIILFGGVKRLVPHTHWFCNAECKKRKDQAASTDSAGNQPIVSSNWVAAELAIRMLFFALGGIFVFALMGHFFKGQRIGLIHFMLGGGLDGLIAFTLSIPFVELLRMLRDRGKR